MVIQALVPGVISTVIEVNKETTMSTRVPAARMWATVRGRPRTTLNIGRAMTLFVARLTPAAM